MYFAFNDGIEEINNVLLRESLFLSCFKRICLALVPKGKRLPLNSSIGQTCCFTTPQKQVDAQGACLQWLNYMGLPRMM